MLPSASVSQRSASAAACTQPHVRSSAHSAGMGEHASARQPLGSTSSGIWISQNVPTAQTPYRPQANSPTSTTRGARQLRVHMQSCTSTPPSSRHPVLNASGTGDEQLSYSVPIPTASPPPPPPLPPVDDSLPQPRKLAAQSVDTTSADDNPRANATCSCGGCRDAFINLSHIYRQANIISSRDEEIRT
jgi:hypothetical protein